MPRTLSMFTVHIYISVLVWVGHVTSVSGAACGFNSNCTQCDPGGRTVCGNVCPSSANLSADAKTYIQTGIFTCAGWTGVIRGSYFPAYTQLESLYLTNAGIASFNQQDKPFKNMPLLKTLTLSHNRIRTFGQTLVGLSRLEELDLSYNNMPAVANKSFETLTALKKLNVGHNQLTSLNADSLFGLATLTTLTVSDNPISFINKNAFQPVFSSIETINMDSMKLSGIVSGLFSQLKTLKHLHISNNSITSIDDSSLAGTSLDELDLSYNHLTALPVRAMKGCSKQPTSLSLAHNDITSISNTDLGDLNVQNLDLSYNQITHIPKDLFLNAPVNNISLRGNPIATIDDGALDGLRLTAIDLSDTGLTTLPSSAEQGLTATAAHVNLDNKNWQCDCGAHWLANLLVMNNSQIVSPTCGATSQYPGTLLSTAKPQMDIDCATTTTSTTITTTTPSPTTTAAPTTTMTTTTAATTSSPTTITSPTTTTTATTTTSTTTPAPTTTTSTTTPTTTTKSTTTSTTTTTTTTTTTPRAPQPQTPPPSVTSTPSPGNPPTAAAAPSSNDLVDAMPIVLAVMCTVALCLAVAGLIAGCYLCKRTNKIKAQTHPMPPIKLAWQPA